MKYKVLGRTGVLVSELCLGTMTFGRETDETEAVRMFNTCRNAGVNLFDCADAYNGGRAEEILGKLIRNCRDEVVIATKVSLRTGGDVNDIGSSRRHIMLAVEQSLKRLQTDRIDFYIIHKFDPLTAMEDTLRALDDLVHQGKVLYLGVSNWAAWQIAKALGISERKNWPRFECIEPMYSLIKRQAEVEILPLAQSEQLGVISYNPLGAGLLTGKYMKDKPPVGRLVENDRYNLRYSDPRYYETVERFINYAQKLGVNPVTLAVSWVKSHSAVTAPIIGARNADQLEASLASADFDMSAEMREEISKLSVHPGNATDRLEEDLDGSTKFRNK